MEGYFAKWRGEEKAGPGPTPSPSFIALTCLGGFLAMGIVSVISVFTEDMDDGWLALVGSYGATTVLVFGAPAGPLSQPRNVLGGNLISTIVGVGTRVWISDPMGNVAFGVPFAVSFSYLLMQLFGMVNPPGGGTAAICVISSPQITAAGWKLVITTTLYSAIFILVACLVINLHPSHSYPKYWFVSSKYYYPKLFAKHEPSEAEKVESGTPSPSPPPPLASV